MFNDSPPGKNNNECCALEIRNDGIAYARICRPPQDQSTIILKECDFYSGDDTLDQVESTLSIIANKYNIKDIACNWVLSPKYYRLLLTNTPNVPPEEYKDALRWQIKDMVDYPPDDIALDTFAPTSFSQSDPPKLYVIAAQSSFMQKVVSFMHQTSFNLQTIDTKEFAIRNLISALPNATQPIGFLHIDGSECLLIIVKNNQLYFVRHIPITTDINQAEQDFTKISDEIQKSLDYYTTELKQDIPIKFLFSPTTDLNNKFTTTIKQNIALPFSTLSLANILQIENEKNFSPDLLNKCYIAIGGALRQNEEQ